MNKRVILAKRPAGAADVSCFAIKAGDEPQCGPDDILLKTVYISMDPSLRLRLDPGDSYASYAPPFEIGQPIVSRLVARVVSSGNPAFSIGDFVWGFLEWAERIVVKDAQALKKIDPLLGRVSYAMSALGMPGLTAWTGAIEIGRTSPGDTFFVSSAAGAVGLLAGQFAKRAGARVVGSAGSDEKVRFLVERCGFDAAFNYKSSGAGVALEQHCPNGIDVYFDNVGGEMLEAALRKANVGARMVICGMTSTYDNTDDHGVRGLGFVLGKRLSMTGFTTFDHVHKMPAYQKRVAPWLRSGELVFQEDVVEGIENAPAAFVGMMKGEVIGKRLVQVAAE